MPVTGKLEVTIKINALPEPKTVENGGSLSRSIATGG
jgi:hypothetical protein